MHKNDAFVTEISNTRQMKICLVIIAVAERLPTSATLISDDLVFNFIIIIQKPADTVKTREQFSFHCHLDDEI